MTAVGADLQQLSIMNQPAMEEKESYEPNYITSKILTDSLIAIFNNCTLAIHICYIGYISSTVKEQSRHLIRNDQTLSNQIAALKFIKTSE